MGAKPTKVEEIFPDSVGAISHKTKPIELEAMNVEGQEYVQNGTPPRPADNLRKRFFKGFTYNLNDPRSPSLFVNRTPLVFDDKNDKTLNLDDTFSDLFVTSRHTVLENAAQVVPNNEECMTTTTIDQNNSGSPLDDFKAFEKSLSPSNTENESSSVDFASLNEEETMPCPAVLKQTPLLLQQVIDPRSPAVGRTPLLLDVFDDDETQEDAMLEDILATLSLDFSGANSSNSFSTAVPSPISVDIKKPLNKQLDRLRARKPEKPIRKSRTAQRQRIYLDCENANVTPKRKANLIIDTEKRTPLSCVKNRVHHLRSRSVESNGKSPKQRLSLTSYDDNLNPVQDRKVIDLHALQGDTFDL